MSNANKFNDPTKRRPQSRYAILSKGLRRKRGEMNRTETEYAARLDVLIAAGEIYRWWFEPFTLRLTHPEKGQPAKVTPDFLVLAADGTTYVDDVKGTGLDDPASAVRMKAAAELYPLWVFRIVKKQRKKDGGDFAIRVL